MTLEKLHSLLQEKQVFSIHEAVVPPFDWNVTVSMINRKSKALKDHLDPLIKTIKENEEMMEDFGMRNLAYYLPQNLERYLRGDYRTSLEGLVQRVNELFASAQQTDDPHYRMKILAEYIPSYIGYFIKDNDPRHFDQYVDEFHKFEGDSEWYNDDADFRTVKGIVQSTQQGLMEMKEFDTFLRNLQEKLVASSKWAYGAYEKDRKFRPEDLAEEEIGYHASFYARQLAKTGFDSAFTRDDSFGLGGSSYEGDISITLDFKVAQTIAWVYKHLWLIAHDQWKLSSVFEFIRKYSTPPKADKGGEYDFNKIVEIFRRNKGHDKFPPQNQETLMDFFIQALWFVNTPVNKNPVFWGFDGAKFKEKLINLDYKDIGVLKVKAKTENISEFLTAEREMRVPAKDIEIISVI